jgi:hypothetical protein
MLRPRWLSLTVATTLACDCLRGVSATPRRFCTYCGDNVTGTSVTLSTGSAPTVALFAFTFFLAAALRPSSTPAGKVRSTR